MIVDTIAIVRRYEITSHPVFEALGSHLNIRASELILSHDIVLRTPEKTLYC
jgi:hypothetical protein